MHHKFILRVSLLTVIALCPLLAVGEDKPVDLTAHKFSSSNKVPETIEELRSLEKHVAEVVKRVTPAIIGIGGGSGVVIDDEGYVLTVGHVGARAGRQVQITFPDGKRAPGKTLGNNRGVDSGMAKLNQKGDWPHAEMGDSSKVKVGQWCLAIGFPASFTRGQQPPVRIGRVLSVSERTIVTDCPLMGGDSGGPLFDLQGNVIALSSRVGGSILSNVHVPVNMYKKEWDRLAAGEDWNDRSSQQSRNGRRTPSRPPMEEEDKPSEPGKQPKTESKAKTDS
ncbi:MAG: S1C family serine protease [Fuerstiella sp.]